jgi:succinate dehydrogenase / fumarate reductase membrane anchor subunit
MSLGDSASDIGKVRGLGSAREGGGEWLAERVTSVALLLLGSWLLASLLFLPALDQRTVVEWLHGPSGAIPMALLVIVAFWHGIDGLKQVTLDYVDSDVSRWVIDTIFFFLAVAGASIALFALARIAFGASA